MKKVAIFGGSFNPPGLHHFLIVQMLIKYFDLVIVIPCGPRPEPEKMAVNKIDRGHRENLVKLAFKDVPKVQLELWDIWGPVFTRTHILDAIYKHEGELWHVVGTDLVRDGKNKQSEIHRQWELGSEIWYKLNFAVIQREGYNIDSDDLPPHSIIFQIAACSAKSSSQIREIIAAGKPFDHLVLPEVANYIKQHNLY